MSNQETCLHRLYNSTERTGCNTTTLTGFHHLTTVLNFQQTKQTVGHFSRLLLSIGIAGMIFFPG